MYLFLQEIKEKFFQEKERWFIWVPVLFALGIGFYFSLSFEPSIWITLGLIEALIVLAIIFRFNQSALFVIAVASLPLFGFTYVQLRAVSLSENLEKDLPENLYVSAAVSDMDYSYRGKPRLFLEDAKDYDGNEIKGKIRVVLNSNKTDVKVGDCIETVLEVQRPFSPSIVDGYQFSRKAFFEGVSWSGFPLARIISTECEKKTSAMGGFHSIVQFLRMKVVEKINKVIPNKDEAGIAHAIVAGQQGLVSEKIYEDYRDSGLAHFLSISGLHMTMIAGLMFFFVRLIIALIPPLAVRYDSKKIAAVLSIFVAFLYLLISGSAVPAQRAFIMIFIVLLGVLFYRQAISMKNIAWAALIVLLISPESLVGPSFQMSFAAVFCLIAFYERHATKVHNILDRGRWFNIVLLYILGILITDLVASLATLPFAVYHFNRIAVYTTLGNFLAGPIICLLIMPFILLSLLLMPLGLEAFALKLMGYGIKAVNYTTHYVASMDGASQQVVSMPTWGLVLIVFGALWLSIWKLNWRFFGWIGIVLGALSVFTVTPPDVVVNGEKRLIAVKDNSGNLVILPARWAGFDKKQCWKRRQVIV